MLNIHINFIQINNFLRFFTLLYTTFVDVYLESQYESCSSVGPSRLRDEIQRAVVRLYQLLWDKQAHTNLIESKVVLWLVKVEYFGVVFLLNSHAQIVDQANKVLLGVIIRTNNEDVFFQIWVVDCILDQVDQNLLEPRRVPVCACWQNTSAVDSWQVFHPTLIAFVLFLLMVSKVLFLSLGASHHFREKRYQIIWWLSILRAKTPYP